MTHEDATRNAESDLGGRLTLIYPDQLTADQRRLHDRLSATRVARAKGTGYQASLDDGRLIGPFNGFLRVPAIGEAQLDWAQAITAAGLAGSACEVAILTVAAEWRASYVLYAHQIAAAAAGVSVDDIADLTERRAPTGLSGDERLAHRLALSLVRHHGVPDDLYSEVLTAFGESSFVALVTLIGQYLATSALVNCFRVPAPSQRY